MWSSNGSPWYLPKGVENLPQHEIGGSSGEIQCPRKNLCILTLEVSFQLKGVEGSLFLMTLCELHPFTSLAQNALSFFLVPHAQV